MNPQETLQATTRDEKWVPSAKRLKINSTNIRLETTMPQKEDTFQVVIDIIKNSTCFKAFTISADVPKIFMQQLWTILNICLRVEGEDFIDVPDDETALTFLIDLSYKGPPNRHANMFVDHMHQLWRTLAAKSEPEPEPTKKKNTIRRVIKKKVTLYTVDNIISDDPDAALELAKFINKTKAEEAEATRKVHAIHARIVTESVSESAKKKSSGRSSKIVVIHDTLSAPKSKPTTSKAKLKGAPSLTPIEQEAANIMQALKESKKTSRIQPSIRGSNEGTGSKLGVPDEDKDITEEKVILEWGDEQHSENSDDDNDDAEKDEKDGDADDKGNDHVSDKQDDDDKDDKTESDEDNIYKYKINVRIDEDEEMKDAEVEGSDKGDEEITDAAKEEAEKTSEAKDDTKKTKLPPSSSSLSVSSSFVQKILVSVTLKTTNLPPILEIVTVTPVTTADPSPPVTPIISTVQQTTTPIPTPTIITDSPTITTAVPKSNALTVVELRVAKLEKDVSELKTNDHSSIALVFLQSYVPTVIDSYLDTKLGDVFQKELQKHTTELIHKYSLQHLLELTKKPTPIAKQEYEKSLSEILKIKKEQAESQNNP
ncbi:hypothetical protein Tco_0719091 [Tanacetum coccineum]